MNHPTRQEEQIDVLTRALGIAAKNVAKGDPAVACGLMDLWILVASGQYVAELKLKETLETSCGHC